MMTTKPVDLRGFLEEVRFLLVNLPLGYSDTTGLRPTFSDRIRLQRQADALLAELNGGGFHDD